MKKWKDRDKLDLFVIRNNNGDYYCDNHNSEDEYEWWWSPMFCWAKVYRTKASANKMIARIAMCFPEHGIPDLVPLKVKPDVPIIQTENIMKVVEKNNKMSWEILNKSL